MEGRALSHAIGVIAKEPACRGGVLPDDSTGQSPGTLARKLSRRAPRERSEQRGCKEGTAQFLPSRYKFYRRRACRGSSLISETNLSRCNKCYKIGTGAVSR